MSRNGVRGNAKRYRLNRGVTAGLFGISAGLFAVFFFSNVPKVRKTLTVRSCSDE